MGHQHMLHGSPQPSNEQRLEAHLLYDCRHVQVFQRIKDLVISAGIKI